MRYGESPALSSSRQTLRRVSLSAADVYLSAIATTNSGKIEKTEEIVIELDKEGYGIEDIAIWEPNANLHTAAAAAHDLILIEVDGKWRYVTDFVSKQIEFS